MTLWVNRAGRRGEWEQAFIDEGKIFLQRTDLAVDLRQCAEKGDLRALLLKTYPSAPEARIRNYLGQVWSFLTLMQIGDWVVLPSKLKRVLHFGEITGGYEFDGTRDPHLRHCRTVNWFAQDVPRSNFAQDTLNSFGPRTICAIGGEQEERIRAMAASGWQPEDVTLQESAASAWEGEAERSVADRSPPAIDLEETARDEIVRLIRSRFKGHELARLVEAVLRAQGYTTHLSPPGPDLGVDILAGSGPLGFEPPRIVVQVKSGNDTTDRPTVDQLIGTMQNFRAEQGLFVSWSGFKSSVDKEIPRQFFRVRLWDADDLIDQILQHYDQLSDDLRAEIPLKRIWTVAAIDEMAADD